MIYNLQRKTIVFIFLLITALIIKLPNVLAEYSEESGPKLVFSRIIVPNQDISILDSTFEVSDDENDPSILRLRKNNITFVLTQDSIVRRFGYEFHLRDNWFDLEKINQRTPDGTPRYGMVSETGGRIYHSYSLRVYLIKPILEFKRTINNQSVSTRSINVYRGDITNEFEINLEIINHGKDHVNFVHKEFLDENMDIIDIHSKNSEVRLVEENGRRYIEVYGNSAENVVVTYSFKALDTIDFTYDSKAVANYENREYTFNERNRLTVQILPRVSLKGGTHNSIDYVRRERRAEVGSNDIRYGIIIKNNFDKNISGANLEITFPKENFRVIHENKEVLNNKVSKPITLSENEEQILRYNLIPEYTGNYSVLARLEYESNGMPKSHEFETIIIANFRPPNANALFDSTEINSSTDMLVYLSNSNAISEFINLRVSVKTIFGDNIEEFEYFFRNVNITSTLLLNRMMKTITNATEDKVIIGGTYETIFGEKLSFNSSITAEQGFRRDYDSRLRAISREHRLDLGFDETIFNSQREISQFWMTVYTLTGLIVNEDNENSTYVLPTLLLFLFLGIQLLITRIKHKKES